MAAKIPVQSVEIKPEIEQLIGEWFAASASAKEAAAKESELRMRVFQNFYRPEDPKLSEPGTDHFAMPGGWILKVGRVINTKVDVAALDAVKKQLATMEADEDGVVPSIDAAVKYKPDFSESGYRDLRDDVKELLNAALTRTPGTPQIKLELPASAKTKPVPEAKREV
jgi:hypothetical protein